MKTSSFALAALAALAVTGLEGLARADQIVPPASISGSYGSGDVQAGYSATAGVIYCTAAEIAAAVPTCAQLNSDGICIKFYNPYPECVVDSRLSAYAKAYAEIDGSITLFGHQKGISVQTMATTQSYSTGQPAYSWVAVVVDAFGNTVFSSMSDSIMVGTCVSFSEHKSYGLVGLSVDVKGEAAVSFGGRFTGGVIPGGVQITGMPLVGAALDASAGVSVPGASAGIDGDITLFEFNLPTTLSVTYASGQVGYGVDTDFNYRVLSGDLEVKACAPLVGCDSTTIASYSGFSNGAKPIQVFSTSGTVSL